MPGSLGSGPHLPTFFPFPDLSCFLQNMVPSSRVKTGLSEAVVGDGVMLRPSLACPATPPTALGGKWRPVGMQGEADGVRGQRRGLVLRRAWQDPILRDSGRKGPGLYPGTRPPAPFLSPTYWGSVSFLILTVRISSPATSNSFLIGCGVGTVLWHPLVSNQGKVPWGQRAHFKPLPTSYEAWKTYLASSRLTFLISETGTTFNNSKSLRLLWG